MSLRKISTAALVATSLTLSGGAPASAGAVVPVTPAASSGGSSSAEKALIGIAIIGLIAWITTGSAASSGATVTKNGGNTTGSFTVLKF